MKRNFKQAVKQIQKVIGDFYQALPIRNFCVLCDHLTEDANFLLCETCEHDLELYELGFDVMQHHPVMLSGLASDYLDGLTIVANYQWPFSQFIPALKFYNDNIHASWFGELLRRQVAHQLWFNIDYIVPMPLHPIRLLKRGYNQAELIASFLKINKLQPDLLSRTKMTKAQTELSKGQRAKNLRGAFVCKREVNNKVILLIDDVVTTGHTLNEAAKVLKQEGATAVYGAAVAIRVLD